MSDFTPNVLSTNEALEKAKKLIRDTVKRFGLSDSTTVEINDYNYRWLCSNIPDELFYKLRLVPDDKLKGRLAHFFNLVKFANENINTLKHLEGLGADYNVHTSDLNVNDVEIDVTTDKNLMAEKLTKIKSVFPNSKVLHLDNVSVDIKIDLASNAFSKGMFAEIKDLSEATASSLLDLICDGVEKGINMLEGKESKNNKIQDKEAIPKVFSNATKDVVDWAKTLNDEYVKILIAVIESYIANKKKYEFRLSEAETEDQNFVLTEAFKRHTEDPNLEPKSYFKQDSNDDMRAEKVDKSLFSREYGQGATRSSFSMAYSKHANCAKILLSDEFDNYLETKHRLELRSAERKNKYAESIREKVDVEVESEPIVNKMNMIASLTRLLNDYDELRLTMMDAEKPVPFVKLHDCVNMNICEPIKVETLTIINMVEKTKIFQIFLHEMEVAMSIANAQRAYSKNNEYKMGKNGAFNSYTFSKMAGTNDKYTNGSYFVVYNPKSRSKWEREVNRFSSTPVWTMSRNEVIWNIKKPLVAIAAILSKCECEGKIISIEEMVEIMFATEINRDTFSQAAEQTRYIFMSSIAGRDITMSVFNKKIMPILEVKSLYEAVFYIRMLKMGENVAKVSSKLGAGTIMSGFNLYMPTCMARVTSFKSIVNDMYTCNLFNKFRTFQLNASALNYLSLLKELDIYNSIKEEINSKVDEISSLSTEKLKAIIKNYPEKIVLSIAEDFLKGPARFSFNVFFVIYAACCMPSGNVKFTSLKNMLISSPIESASLNGSMEPGISETSQANRVAGVIVDGIIKHSSEYELGTIENCSIYSIKCAEAISKDTYRYRITPKDQKGHREISVLNYEYRVAALFVETVFKQYVNKIEEDVLMSSDKKRIFHDVVMSMTEVDLADNSDASRWGPNSLVELFAVVTNRVIPDDDISFLINNSFTKMMSKRGKVPEDILSFFRQKKSVSDDCTLAELKKRVGKSLETEFRFGMGQGILHQTSSIYHCAVNRATKNIVEKLKIAKIKKSLITSDDVFRVVEINKESNYGRAKFSDVLGRILALGNVIRNEEKSVLSPVIAEFNSIFYYNKSLAVPIIKRATADIDAGQANDMIVDMLTSVCSGVPTLNEGGSVLLADFVAAASLYLTKEQWNIFQTQRSKDPLRGGDPAYSSIIAMVSSSIGISALSEYTDQSSIIDLWVSSIKEQTALVELSDTVRDFKGNLKGNLSGPRVLLERGISGLINLFHYRKSYIPFVKRYKFTVSKDFAPSFNRSKATGKNLVFYMARNFSSKKYIGVNTDLFKRMTEAKVSVNALAYITKKGERLNRIQMLEHLKSYTMPITSDEVPGVREIITTAVIRAKVIKEAMEEAILSNEVKLDKLKPVNLKVDTVVDLSADELREVFYKKCQLEEPLLKMIFADNMVNILYGTTPMSLKFYAPERYSSTIQAALNRIISCKPLIKGSLAIRPFFLPVSDKYISEEGADMKEAISVCSKIAMNMYLRPDRRRETDFINNNRVVLITEDITKVSGGFLKFKRSAFKSASNKCVASLSKEAVGSILLSENYSKAVWKLEGTLIKIFSDTVVEASVGVVTFCRVQYIKEGVYTHFIIVDRAPDKYVLRSSSKFLDGLTERQGSERVLLVEITDTDTLRMHVESPFIYTCINNIVIPLYSVYPKLYSNFNALVADFPPVKVDAELDATKSYKTAACKEVLLSCLTGETPIEDDLLTACCSNIYFTDREINMAKDLLGTNMIGSKSESFCSELITETGASPKLPSKVDTDDIDFDKIIEDFDIDKLNNEYELFDFGEPITPDSSGLKAIRYNVSPINICIKAIVESRDSDELIAVLKKIIGIFNVRFVAVMKIVSCERSKKY